MVFYLLIERNSDDIRWTFQWSVVASSNIYQSITIQNIFKLSQLLCLCLVMPVSRMQCVLIFNSCIGENNALNLIIASSLI